MATYTWYLQGTSPTTIDSDDYVQFAAATFDSAITVAAYNDSTHVESSVGANDSTGNTPNNVKYIASGTGDWGDGTEALNLMATGEATLKINFSHGSAVAVTGHTFYAYNGAVQATGPTDVTFFAAEQGDAAWTQAEGSGSAVTIDDSGSASSHDFYIACSASPDTVGEKTSFKLRDELTYS